MYSFLNRLCSKIARDHRPSIRFTRFMSFADTSVPWRRRRLRLRDFLAKMWLLYARRRLNFPLAVFRNRFAAARCVFIFVIGTSPLSMSL
jgi:hypothetical protein